MLVPVWLAACGVVTPATDPEPPSEAQLDEACGDGIMVDHAPCLALARLRTTDSRWSEAVTPYRRACRRLGTACVELGTLYLQGRPDLPRDLEKGFETATKGCHVTSKDRRGCSWSVLERLTRYAADPVPRDSIEGAAALSCRYATSHGWGCFNYGVGLSCGLFYDKDVAYARHVLDRGCRLGDSRACKLSIQLRDHPEKPVSCELIGPDPDVPVDLSLHLEPLPADAVWPEGQERHQRKPMP